MRSRPPWSAPSHAAPIRWSSCRSRWPWMPPSRPGPGLDRSRGPHRRRVPPAPRRGDRVCRAAVRRSARARARPGAVPARRSGGAGAAGGVVERAFGGDPARFGRFISTLQAAVPDGTRIILRGSAVQGVSYKSGEPFDGRGPGTSDLDVVLVGDEAMAEWQPDAFYLPGVNTMPLWDKARWVAPTARPASGRGPGAGGSAGVAAGDGALVPRPPEFGCRGRRTSRSTRSCAAHRLLQHPVRRWVVASRCWPRPSPRSSPTRPPPGGDEPDGRGRHRP